MAPLASVIVPTLNGAHLLPDCLDSLMRQTYANLEVIVADGASTDATQPLLASAYPRVRLLRLRRNAGFSGNVNAGFRAARGDVLCLLNNDAQAEPDWIAVCVETLSARPSIGSVASKVLFADRRRSTVPATCSVGMALPVSAAPASPDGHILERARAPSSAPRAARRRTGGLCSPIPGYSTRRSSCTWKTSTSPFAPNCSAGSASTSRWRACITAAALPEGACWNRSTTGAT